MRGFTNIEDANAYINNFAVSRSNADNEEIIDNLKSCEQISIKYNDKPLLIRSRIHLTEYHIQQNDLQNALLIALQNKSMAKDGNHKEEELKCYSGLMHIYYLLGDYGSLEELIYAYRQKLLDSNDLSKLCSVNIFSAIQHYALKNYKKCIEANQKALEYAIKLNSKPLLIHVYNNFGFHAISIDITLAEKNLLECLKLIKENGNNLHSLAAAHTNLADLYFRKNDFKLCNKSLDIAIKSFKAINDKITILEAQNRLCELFIYTEKYAAAQKLLTYIEKECLSTNNKYILLTCYAHFYKLFERTRKYKSAYTYLLKHQTLKEEIFNEESNQKIRNLQIANETINLKREKELAEHIASLKHDFLANMSHEIRTPINSVLGICYLLKQDALSDKQLNYIQRLERSGENLLGLINEILDLSKIEAGKLDLVLAPFTFNQVLSDAVQLLQHKADEKNIRLHFSTVSQLDKQIIGDSLKVSQILINLISNAVKFTKDGEVKIDVSTEKSDDDTLMLGICVSDTGIGIPEDKIESIFERYEQAASTIKTQFGGTGLGLAISKKIIELMNGTISVKSVINKGTTFMVHIPFKKHELVQSVLVDKRQDTAFLEDLYILIADDNDENRRITGDLLKHFNPSVKIQEAVNGSEVLELLKKEMPDIILMDLDMPVMNGVETVKYIRNNINDPISIIANTAGLLTNSKEEILQLGFDELITKPFKPADLLEKLSIVSNYQ